MDEEKRTFSRIPVRLKGHIRPMRSIDSPQRFSGDSGFQESSGTALFKGSQLPEELTRFLSEVDRKLDQIIGMLSKETVRSDFPVDIEIMEISGAGVKFRSSHQFEPNAPLEMVMVLNQLPVQLASSKGRILKKEPDTELYRFEFVDMRGSDMETIVQFVFKQQRELIRNSKM
ncbi:PilZ domain-containing protein [Pseudodesulfovibrio sp. JC047]|uniref:PilZ domain-containing protein n=1 Tax=Pseudodesulfovibrio sp. JC047 TaxID=2683199 RepID=UPI0013D89A01|nr:PilZ domain-containing protein [Pseudodesulfovibrio sp. JC047]NDV20539.1 PilZ domain-containing protein [Pseudodesulfovibrio sp. JC047]